MFIAIQELSFEGIDFFGNACILAVVHSVASDDSLSAETLGVFLHKNSKEFSCRMRENMMYQDLQRVCCLTIENQGKAEEVKVFIKKALKGFAKGRQNVNLFIAFATLPSTFLNKFETFMILL